MTVRRELRTPRLGSRRLVDAGWALAWIAGVVGIEVVGRRGGGELPDVLLLAAAASLLVVTARAGTRRRIGWYARLVEGRLERLRGGKALWGSCGLDMRGGDAVRRGLPRTRIVALGTVLVLLVPALAFAPHLPGGLRTAGAATSYTLYLAVLAALLGVGAFAVMGLSYFGSGVIGDARIRAADNRGVARSGRSPSARLLLLPVVAALALSLSPIPALVPAAGIVGCLVALAGLTALPRFRRVQVVWRRPGLAPRRAGLGAHMLVETALVGCVGLLVVTLGTGLDLAALDARTLRTGAAGLGTVSPHPLTGGITEAAAWATLFGLGAMTWRVAALAGAAARGDPVAPGLRVVRTTEPLPRSTQRVLAAAGWRVRPPDAPPERGEVVVDPDLHDLASDAGLVWLARRHEIQQRRHVRRGLRRLLRAAARFSPYDQGAGFWIAPHLWFVPSLSRDEEEEDSIRKGTGAIDQVLGPDHETVFPLAARAHLHVVLASVDVDLIFVEDGVRFAGLRRVLGVIFEVHDVHGGARRVQDRDFAGLTGLRVVVHDFDLDNPYRAEGYPEPDYEDVARARVLHVFRDRGGEEEDVRAPAPGDRVPLLV